MRLVVIGAGIAGLAAAGAARLEAERAGLELEVVLLEASDRAGGKLWTEEVDGLTVEWGPDAFLAAKPRGSELAAELGLDLVPIAPGGRRAFLLQGGRLRPVPEGLVMGVPTTAGAAWRAMRGGLLPIGGAMRAAVEPLLPGVVIGEPDEPARDVVRRRLGRSAAVRLVEPLLRGVFGAPGSEIGVRSAYPQAFGSRSLARALRRPPSTAPLRPPGAADEGAQFLAVRGGFGAMVDALAAALPGGAVRTGTAVHGAAADGDAGFVVATSRGDLRADAILVATTSGPAAEVLATVAPEASEAFRGIRYGSSAVVLLRYPAGSLVRTTDGSGFLVDPEEGLAIAACSWFSSKWPHLTGDGVVLRAVVTDPAHLAAGDDALRDRVAAEVGRVMGARAEPDLVRMRRWDEALPIFGPGHHDRIGGALATLPERVAVAGAYLGAVGIPDCIVSGEDAAGRLVAALARDIGRR
jgi:oxygen-dependent protoporphyrinogen oxidase